MKKNNRRKFLKKAGSIGVGIAGLGLIPAVAQTENAKSFGKNWEEDPEWQKIRYGDWGGPGVRAGPGPMDDILLKDYAPKSSVIVPETSVEKARFPVIDTNVKNYPERETGNTPDVIKQWVETMDEVGIEVSVLRTGVTGTEFDRLVQMYLGPYPDRFLLYCGIEQDNIHSSDYPERAVAELVRCYENGARGVGEITDKGYGLTEDPNLSAEQRLHHDDPRLDMFWEKCAELDLPVNIHVADHPSAWEPLDIFQERTPEYQHFNQSDADILSVEELMTRRDRLIERHPDTIFIACHFSNQGNDLRELGNTLEKYPNLYVDTSSRDYEIGRTPRAASMFFMTYQDRILFGTDMGMNKKMYQAWWRLLESSDEYMTGRVWWQYYGLGLSDTVLKSLYRDNAKRILNWKTV
jgi:uncharacterized protein